MSQLKKKEENYVGYATMTYWKEESKDFYLYKCNRWSLGGEGGSDNAKLSFTTPLVENTSKT